MSFVIDMKFIERLGSAGRRGPRVSFVIDIKFIERLGSAGRRGPRVPKSGVWGSKPVVVDHDRRLFECGARRRTTQRVKPRYRRGEGGVKKRHAKSLFLLSLSLPSSLSQCVFVMTREMTWKSRCHSNGVPLTSRTPRAPRLYPPCPHHPFPAQRKIVKEKKERRKKDKNGTARSGQM